MTSRPCAPATVAPPKHLPMTSELRRTGATIISRRKPNSRSQTSDAAENIAVNSTAMHSTPGYTNVRRLTPCVPPEVRRDSPDPSTKRNRNGCTSEVTIQPVLREADELALPDDLHRDRKS